MQSTTTITPEVYVKLKNNLLEYLKKNGISQPQHFIAPLNRFLEYLHKHNITFSTLKESIVEEYHGNKRCRFSYIRDFLKKYGYVIKDVKAGANSQCAHTFGEYIEKYLSIRQQEGIRNETIALYRYGLRCFERYTNNIPLQEITTDTLEAYMKHLLTDIYPKTKRPCSVNAVIIRMVTIKCYLRYLIKNNTLVYNPAENLKLPRAEKRISQNYLTKDEMQIFFDNFKTGSDYIPNQKLMYLLCYQAGLRETELVNIEISDVDFDTGMLLVKEGKGGYERTVPLLPNMLQLLKEHVRHNPNNTFLFQTIHGKKIRNKQVQFNLLYVLKKMNWEKQFSTHAFRKSIGKHLLENGLDVRYVQRFLGHNNINSTAAYTHLNIEDLKNAVLQYHPREKDKSKYIVKFRGGTKER